MSYYHASFDSVKEFYPRVPESRITGEDKCIERICVTESVRDSVSAIPGLKNIAENIQDIKYEPVIHVCELVPEKEEDVLSDISLYVPDSEFTHEAWFLRKPKEVIRHDYIWRDTYIEYGTINNISWVHAEGEFVEGPKMDEYQKFVEDFNLQNISDGLRKVIESSPMRTFLCSLSTKAKELLLLRKNMQREKAV